MMHNKALLLIAFAAASTVAITFEQDTKLTKTQAQAFDKYKSRVLPKLTEDYQKEDHFLLRYLKAKNFDVQKGEDYILTDMKWRRDYKMDTIHNEDWSDMEKEYTMRVEGNDRDGRPLVIWELGDWDLRKAALAGKMDRVVRWTLKNWDMGMVKVRELQHQGKNITRWTMVLDLKNINPVTNVNPASLPYYISVSPSYHGHFPGLGDHIYLLNTPGIFQAVLGAVRPLLDDETRDHLKVHGKNEAQWLPILKQRVDLDQLPKRYGGTKEDPA
jgi:hypothetical protein